MKDIPRMGKDAAEFTRKLLTDGKPRLWTRGDKALKNPGRPQRYYALVEVTAPDGKRRWLHELLLENGHARAFGVPAPWPHEVAELHGEEEACKRFARSLKTLEHEAKRRGLGVWRKAGGR